MSVSKLPKTFKTRSVSGSVCPVSPNNIYMLKVLYIFLIHGCLGTGIQSGPRPQTPRLQDPRQQSPRPKLQNPSVSYISYSCLIYPILVLYIIFLSYISHACLIHPTLNLSGALTGWYENILYIIYYIIYYIVYIRYQILHIISPEHAKIQKT